MSPVTDSDRIAPDDPRYDAVVRKQFNKRFWAAPDYVRLAASTADVVGAVADAVSEGRRLVVTSGGHCLEGFVTDPEVRVILDVSPINDIAYGWGFCDMTHFGRSFKATYGISPQHYRSLHKTPRSGT